MTERIVKSTNSSQNTDYSKQSMAVFLDKSLNYSLNQTLKTFELKNNSFWLKIILK